ncbi:MAG: anaerobic ribonucleoside triphosphate reductase, partial [Fibrobacter sp.]|nr:anaerobic ribonucleoside triphosphate reductase [Fibrobacter sp.]
MIFTVRKRDGREMPFNIEKISDAIIKAFRASGELNEQIKASQEQIDLLGHEDVLSSTALKVAAYAVGRLEAEGKTKPDIEEIQDAVEKALTDNNYADTAKSYILYRAERTRIREVNTRLMHTLRDITFSSAKESDLKRENANIDGDTAMGTMLKYGSESAKHFYTMMMLKPEHSRAHSDGDIHIHDLDFYSLTMTCCQIDLIKLFKNGFNTGHGHLREPKDIRSYAALAAIAIQSNQNDQHGCQSVQNFDYAMENGVRISYRKAYLSNMVKALILFTGKEEEEIMPIVKKLHSEMEQMGMVATLVPNENFVETEARELSKTFDTEMVMKAQKFAEKQAYEETDKATFQA